MPNCGVEKSRESFCVIGSCNDSGLHTIPNKHTPRYRRTKYDNDLKRIVWKTAGIQFLISPSRQLVGWRNGNALVSGSSKPAKDSGFESQARRFANLRVGTFGILLRAVFHFRSLTNDTKTWNGRIMCTRPSGHGTFRTPGNCTHRPE